jgi:hypothetical protein
LKVRDQKAEEENRKRDALKATPLHDGSSEKKEAGRDAGATK